MGRTVHVLLGALAIGTIARGPAVSLARDVDPVEAYAAIDRAGKGAYSVIDALSQLVLWTVDRR